MAKILFEPPSLLAYGRLSKINILADKPIPAERTFGSRRAVGMGLSPRFLNLDFATVGQGPNYTVFTLRKKILGRGLEETEWRSTDSSSLLYGTSSG